MWLGRSLSLGESTPGQLAAEGQARQSLAVLCRHWEIHCALTARRRGHSFQLVAAVMWHMCKDAGGSAELLFANNCMLCSDLSDWQMHTPYGYVFFLSSQACNTGEQQQA